MQIHSIKSISLTLSIPLLFLSGLSFADQSKNSYNGINNGLSLDMTLMWRGLEATAEP